MSFAAAALMPAACVAESAGNGPAATPGSAVTLPESVERTINVKDEAIAVLGGGCFWCLEAAYELVPGVLGVESGYTGGSKENPSYEQVSSGSTGHAEVVRVRYDPSGVSYRTLLDLFWKIHDPTTKDRQGADVGSQYRSIILYSSPEQQADALASIAAIAPNYGKPVVTAVEPLGAYWPAEQYHQDFYKNNPNYGYCQVVVAPKVEKAKSFVEALVPATGRP